MIILVTQMLLDAPGTRVLGAQNQRFQRQGLHKTLPLGTAHRNLVNPSARSILMRWCPDSESDESNQYAYEVTSTHEDT